jgi:hypothetical protein
VGYFTSNSFQCINHIKKVKKEFLVLSSSDEDEMFDVEADSLQEAAMIALQQLGWFVIQEDVEDEESPKKYHTKYDK